MSVQLTISAFLESSWFDRDLAEREQKIRDLLNGLEQVEEQTTNSFNKVMTMMRGSYMVVSGFARVMGSGFSRIFQGIWSVVTSTIMTYKALIPATLALPGGQLQAAVMIMSLVAASANVVSLLSQQKDVARQARGINFALHGISSMIQSFSI